MNHGSTNELYLISNFKLQKKIYLAKFRLDFLPLLSFFSRVGGVSGQAVLHIISEFSLERALAAGAATVSTFLTRPSKGVARFTTVRGGMAEANAEGGVRVA